MFWSYLAVNNAEMVDEQKKQRVMKNIKYAVDLGAEPEVLLGHFMDMIDAEKLEANFTNAEKNKGWTYQSTQFKKHYEGSVEKFAKKLAARERINIGGINVYQAGEELKIKKIWLKQIGGETVIRFTTSILLARVLNAASYLFRYRPNQPKHQFEFRNFSAPEIMTVRNVLKYAKAQKFIENYSVKPMSISILGIGGLKIQVSEPYADLYVWVCNEGMISDKNDDWRLFHEANRIEKPKGMVKFFNYTLKQWNFAPMNYTKGLQQSVVPKQSDVQAYQKMLTESGQKSQPPVQNKPPSQPTIKKSTQVQPPVKNPTPRQPPVQNGTPNQVQNVKKQELAKLLRDTKSTTPSSAKKRQGKALNSLRPVSQLKMDKYLVKTGENSSAGPIEEGRGSTGLTKIVDQIQIPSQLESEKTNDFENLKKWDELRSMDPTEYDKKIEFSGDEIPEAMDISEVKTNESDLLNYEVTSGYVMVPEMEKELENGSTFFKNC